MKTCTKCGTEKPETDFRFKNKSKNIRVWWCKPCYSHHEREKWASDPNRRNSNKSHNKKRRQRNQQFVWDYLLANPCVKCTEPDPVVLEFDHRDPATKLYDISDMSRGAYSIEMIQAEIDKCDVLCANCHKRRTAKQFGFYEKILVGRVDFNHRSLSSEAL